MATNVQIGNFNYIKSRWAQFKVERNMPCYYGRESPTWLTMLEREELIDQLLNLCGTLIKGKQ